jgi:hypothetical protein
MKTARCMCDKKDGGRANKPVYVAEDLETVKDVCPGKERGAYRSSGWQWLGVRGGFLFLRKGRYADGKFFPFRHPKPSPRQGNGQKN